MQAKQFWSFLATMLVTGVVLAAYDFLRPLNVDVFAPEDNVPETCARFFSATGWGNGAWNENRPHELYVTQMDFDCNVDVLYGFGGWDHDGSGEWLSLAGTIRGDKLLLAIDIYEADVFYLLSEDGESLSGRFESRDRTRIATVRLTRL
jgi:hypothetical protein